MRLDREGRRTVAHFLNGVAVAILVVGALGPVASGDAAGASVAFTILAVAALHGLALIMTTSGER